MSSRAGALDAHSWTITVTGTWTCLFRTTCDSPSNTHRRSEEHTSELQSRLHLVCRLLLEKKKPPSRASRFLLRRRVFTSGRYSGVVRVRQQTIAASDLRPRVARLALSRQTGGSCPLHTLS